MLLQLLFGSVGGVCATPVDKTANFGCAHKNEEEDELGKVLERSVRCARRP